VENREKKAMIAAFRNQKCPDAKTKRVGHSAFKLGREGKCVRLIGVHPQDTGDAMSRASMVGMPPAAQARALTPILRITMNVAPVQRSQLETMTFQNGIIVAGMTRDLPSCARREGAGAGA
jgi:hypothetical protein